MPLLKFRCKSCGIVFDQLVFSSAMDAVRCETCGEPVERAYEGACLFGNPASSAGRKAGCDNCSGSCGCGGCHAGR